MRRRKTRQVSIGSVVVGGSNPVAIQSMAKVKTSLTAQVLRQIRLLEKEGCEIVRLSVKDDADAAALNKIKAQSPLPLVADIHFDWRLAMAAISAGVDKVRVNPGNISDKRRLAEIALAAADKGIALRLGLNSGSLPSGIKGNPVDRMVSGALQYLRVIEKTGFKDLVISLKASSVQETVAAYSKMAPLCDYPFHLGVTATGLPAQGMIKSAVAIGALLLNGIGDTIRVSLTDTPQQEIRAAKLILEAAGSRSFGHEVISCPTCGRCEVNLAKTVKDLGRALQLLPQAGLGQRNLKIAVMGCVVNGPGEAKAADIGIAFGRKEGLLFKSGVPVGKVPYDKCLKVLLAEVKKLSAEQ